MGISCVQHSGNKLQVGQRRGDCDSPYPFWLFTDGAIRADKHASPAGVAELGKEKDPVSEVPVIAPNWQNSPHRPQC